MRIDGGAAITLGGSVTSHVLTADLSPGVHFVIVTACDRFDHCGSTPVRSFEVVGTQPTAPAPLAPTGSTYVATPRPEFSWAPATDDVGIDDQEYAISDSDSVLYLEELLDYVEHTWFVRACDLAGNCTDSPSQVFTIRPYIK
ncbi:hypothetical protein MXAN_0505 [Myxococcus xanthus DK 1622]|uniref:Uncharacterized protein n=1 Tax=Myxococcus xanthus (strain DK1622) TaxID=246197 RepID=Q1DEZ9_MYXXD|nr:MULTISPECIES: hypothetical protein [Myxococcus]ABF88649.1 hypothetical protein MXAN_0505 [Myxococcus xanthus DK 1622]QPM80205.1 hypothetical protein I5Q59_02595 [Myxococcus xanthus]QVW69269.1 hypothetical protein JTM82_06885 [Myxococcus xanthus DZ2]QZZ48050.1 hypothetical protein MyxoNM_02500 [Myxococcus xanthus]UEO04604.1 hypothetical protein K1515_35925 [Myxococcus xanthus DZ2]